MKLSITNVPEFIGALGGLHDARVTKLLWSPAELQFHLEVEDLYASLEGLSGYPGPKRGTFIFNNVERLIIEVDLTQPGLGIYDWEFKENHGLGYHSELGFSPGGRIIVVCHKIDCFQEEPS